MKKIIWVIVIAILLLIVAAIAVFVFVPKRPETGKPDFKSAFNKKQTEPSAIIKNLPVDLAPYDPSTAMAGDMKFTKDAFQFDLIFTDYAFLIPASRDFPAKTNPQAAFVAPLKTKVKAMNDGIVTRIPKLYSDDYSVIVAEKNDPQYEYVLEHVVNPLVKVGDRVQAGQVVAEISPANINVPGFGMVEIGILEGGQYPTNWCPFLYLDPTSKDKILGDLRTFYSDWNAFKGKKLYNTDSYTTPGCLTEEKIIEKTQ